MNTHTTFNPEFLSQHGLNLHAVFDIQSLPQDIKQQLAENNKDLSSFSQIILIGNGGRLFWKKLGKFGNNSENPVDDYSCSLVSKWTDSLANNFSYKIIYPPSCDINLQKIGQLVGWHHHSPFMVGINNNWGTWYAYRVVILTDSTFEVHPYIEPGLSPCKKCAKKPCITQCPGKAVTEKKFSLDDCINYRQEKNSSCRTTCLSRISCPVATEHQYTEKQINYHYSRSLQTIINCA